MWNKRWYFLVICYVSQAQNYVLCLYNMEMRNTVLETVQSYCSCFQTSIVIQVQLTYNVALVSCVQHSHSTSPHVMLCSQVELPSVTLQCCYVIFDVIPSAVPFIPWLTHSRTGSLYFPTLLRPFYPSLTPSKHPFVLCFYEFIFAFCLFCFLCST